MSQLDRKLSQYVESVGRAEPSVSPGRAALIEQSASKAERNSSSQKRKSMAPFRTTGEQVGHLLFRKSTILRSNNIAGQKDGSNVAMQGS